MKQWLSVYLEETKNNHNNTSGILGYTQRSSESRHAIKKLSSRALRRAARQTPITDLFDNFALWEREEAWERVIELRDEIATPQYRDPYLFRRHFCSNWKEVFSESLLSDFLHDYYLSVEEEKLADDDSNYYDEFDYFDPITNVHDAFLQMQRDITPEVSADDMWENKEFEELLSFMDEDFRPVFEPTYYSIEDHHNRKAAQYAPT